MAADLRSGRQSSRPGPLAALPAAALFGVILVDMRAHRAAVSGLAGALPLLVGLLVFMQACVPTLTALAVR